MFFPAKCNSNKTGPRGSDEDLNNGIEELDDDNNGGPQFCEDGLEPLEMQKLSKHRSQSLTARRSVERRSERRSPFSER